MGLGAFQPPKLPQYDKDYTGEQFKRKKNVPVPLHVCLFTIRGKTNTKKDYTHYPKILFRAHLSADLCTSSATWLCVFVFVTEGWESDKRKTRRTGFAARR